MAEEHKFTRGEPLAFRATTQIHLGKIEKYIMEDDVVMFDGQTLDYGGEKHVLPQLRGAVVSGWLVPEADTTTKYVPQPADIKIRPAQAADMNSRGEAMPLEHIAAEDRVVGTVGPTEEIKDATVRDARSVGTISTPAFQKTKVIDASAASREISRLDNTPPPKATFEKSATGDVTVAAVGETLTDILPNAATSGVPKATKTAKKTRGRRGNKIVKLATGDSWDMARHWRTRARDAVRRYGDDTEVLNAIKTVEVPSVVKFIDERLVE